MKIYEVKHLFRFYYLCPSKKKRLKIYKEISAEIITGTVATIGIFDGVHLAHRQIINRLTQLSKELVCQNLLITFWPHPRYVLNKDATDLKLLTSLNEKLELLKVAGIDNVLLIPFDKQFASTSFDKFIQKYLVEKLKVKHLVVGFNHQFGKNREGNLDNLGEYAKKGGFVLEQMPKIEIANQRISSSSIRILIGEGKIDMANSMLGYTYCLSGKIVGGNKLGRKLGFPTANLEVSELYKLIPSDGVYAVQAEIQGDTYHGMMNIGVRPTLHQKGQQVIETNFFNFTEDLYNKEITIQIFKRIREEKKFSSVDLLVEQISVDKIEIQKYFKLINR
jgi:riboflavin kinase / FMN adenylyltransferase